MMTLRITGFAELEAALRKLPEEIAGKVLGSALKEASGPIAERASSLAPRSDTPSSGGHMADSISVRAIKQEPAPGELEVAYWIGPDRKHFYGLFAEFGTRHESARPFLRPAWDEGAERVLEDFGRTLGTAMERAAKRLARGT